MISTSLLCTMCSLFGICFTAAPVFTTPSVPGRSIQVAETVPSGTSVYRVVAIDADADRLIYSITAQIPASPVKFSISSTAGVLSTLSEFDADEENSILEYQLAIRVTDGTNNIETTLLMLITDENDNSPVFRNYHVVRDYSKPGTVIATLLAPDLDSGDNGRVTYMITGGNSGGAFGLDSQSGVLYTMYGLRYDEMSMYRLFIEARDRGSPPRTSTTTMTISLIESIGNGAETMRLQTGLQLALFVCFIIVSL